MMSEESGMSKEDIDKIIILIAEAMLIALDHYLRVSDAFSAIVMLVRQVERMCDSDDPLIAQDQSSRSGNPATGIVKRTARLVLEKIRGCCPMKNREIEEPGHLGKRNPSGLFLSSLSQMEETNSSSGVIDMGTSYPIEPSSLFHPESMRDPISGGDKSILSSARQTTTTTSMITTHTVIENEMVEKGKASKERVEEKMIVERTVQTQVAQA